MRSSSPRSGPGLLPLLLGLGMLVFALLQLNDPDPLIWVSYYAQSPAPVRSPPTGRFPRSRSWAWPP